MRILFLTGEYPPTPSGVGDYVCHLARSLSRQGHNMGVLTSHHDSLGDEPDQTVEVFRRMAHWNRKALPLIQDFLEAWSPEILHIQFITLSFGGHPFINFLPLNLKRDFPRLKIVTTYHEFAAPWRRLALLPMLTGSDINIVTNEDHFSRVGRRLKSLFLKNRLTLVRMGPGILPVSLFPKARETLRSKLGVGKEEILLVRFGMLHSLFLKELKTVFKALAELRKENFPVKLLHLGHEEPLAKQDLLEYASELSISEVLRFTGYLPPEEISAHLFASDIAIAPYPDGLSEKWSALLSLLAHGLPIVTTHKGYFPGPFRDGENLLCVPVGCEASWRGAIRRLITDRGLRERVAAGAKTAASSFDWAQIAAQTLNLYQGLIR